MDKQSDFIAGSPDMPLAAAAEDALYDQGPCLTNPPAIDQDLHPEHGTLAPVVLPVLSSTYQSAQAHLS